MPNAPMNDHATGADPLHHDPVGTALIALRAAAQELAVRDDTPVRAGVQLTAAIRQAGQGCSAQQLLAVYTAIYQARDAARMATRPARYRWEHWAEVSRLARECLTAAVQAMRARLNEERAAAALLRQQQHAAPGAR